MNGTHGDDFRSKVLQAVDIVDLIGRSVALKRRGKDFVGLCPFHQEKTPSFHVSPSKQYFHCYGCKAGGTAIDFVMKRDRVEFRDALRTLADVAGMEMPRSGISREKAGERQQLLDACSQACALFEKLLTHPEQGEPARAYLEQRGIDAGSISRFQIGFAPAAWDTVLNALSRKFPAAVLQQAGLVKARESGNGFYDTFRNRLIFPIRDENGRVIAFGGRTMPGSEDPAKYLNSPETPLFSKSRSVFGLDLARHRIVETRSVAVVEGYTDVVMAHQFGVSNVVSILGTAMTEQHVAILRRFADRIVLLFDADTAGDTAVQRAVELFLTQPIDFAVASMPPDVDPDEYLLEHGGEKFQALLNDAPTVLQYLVRQFKKAWQANSNDTLAQERAMQTFVEPFVQAKAQRSSDDTRWAAVIAALAKETGMSTAALHRKYSVDARAKKRQAAQGAQRGEPTKSAPRRPPIAGAEAERQVLGLLFAEPSRWQDVQRVVGIEDFTDDLRRELAEAYWSHQRDEGEPVFNEFLSQLSDDSLRQLAMEVLEEIEALPDWDATMEGTLLHFQWIRAERGAQKLIARLTRREGQPAEQDEVSLLKIIQEKARQPDLRRV